MNGLLISTIIALALSHLIAFGFGWLFASEHFRPVEPSAWAEADYGDFPSVSSLFAERINSQSHNGTYTPEA